MTKFQRYLEDDGDDDRILRIPRNVVEDILGFLPLRDAARTSVLSTKWRYLWVDQPSLVLDMEFWSDIKRHKLSDGLSIDFSGIVNRILQHHTGNVEKFVVDISVISSDRHCDANLWLSVLNRKCVKELYIGNSESNPFTLPSCVFSAPELKILSISNCIMKTKETNLMRLRSLSLYGITLDSCVLKTPLLTFLTLEQCLGIRGFSISAPTLVSLALKNNDDLNLMTYLICTNITYAYICVNKSIVNLRGVKRINLVKLLSYWPKLANFTVDGLSLQYLTTGIALNTKFSLRLNLTRFWPFNIDVDQHTPWLLKIIGNSPFLQTLEVWLLNDQILQTSLELPLVSTNVLRKFKRSLRMKQLHTVKISFFNGSKLAFQFVSILLYCTPKLKQMHLELGVNTNSISVNLSNELMRLQRAYPKVEIIVGQM